MPLRTRETSPRFEQTRFEDGFRDLRALSCVALIR